MAPGPAVIPSVSWCDLLGSLCAGCWEGGAGGGAVESSAETPALKGVRAGEERQGLGG